MSYQLAINAIKAQVESVLIDSSNLVYTPDPRIRFLARANRAKFDGSYLIRNNGGGMIFEELQLNPSVFSANISLEIGTELTTDAQTNEQSAQLRGQKTLEGLLVSNLNKVVDLQTVGSPSLSSADDRRIVWSQSFNLIYEE